MSNKKSFKRLSGIFVLSVLGALVPTVAAAADKLDTGDTAWLLASTALVLFMTIPGLALFYGGLVRTKNVLSVLMQCLALTALMTLLWLAIGYSLAFDTTGMVAGETNLNSFLGGFGKAFLLGVGPETLSGSEAWSTASATSLALGQRSVFLDPKECS